MRVSGDALILFCLAAKHYSIQTFKLLLFYETLVKILSKYRGCKIRLMITLLDFLIIWFLISIPASLLVGYLLSFGSRRQMQDHISLL